jgi:hypothetical protein
MNTDPIDNLAQSFLIGLVLCSALSDGYIFLQNMSKDKNMEYYKDVYQAVTSFSLQKYEETDDGSILIVSDTKEETKKEMKEDKIEKEIEIEKQETSQEELIQETVSSNPIKIHIEPIFENSTKEENPEKKKEKKRNKEMKEHKEPKDTKEYDSKYSHKIEKEKLIEIINQNKDR